jgi:hypothetical protein
VVTESLVSHADASLQTFNDLVLTQAQKESAFALERAASASQRAVIAETNLAEAKKSAALAEQRAAEATSKAERDLQPRR